MIEAPTFFLSFPLCCCRRPPFLKQAEYMDVNSALQERSYIISRCSLMPLSLWIWDEVRDLRSKSLVQTWFTKILRLVCDYVVQLFVLPVFSFVIWCGEELQQNSTVFHMEMNLAIIVDFGGIQ